MNRELLLQFLEPHGSIFKVPAVNPTFAGAWIRDIDGRAFCESVNEYGHLQTWIEERIGLNVRIDGSLLLSVLKNCRKDEDEVTLTTDVKRLTVSTSVQTSSLGLLDIPEWVIPEVSGMELKGAIETLRELTDFSDGKSPVRSGIQLADGWAMTTNTFALAAIVFPETKGRIPSEGIPLIERATDLVIGERSFVATGPGFRFTGPMPAVSPAPWLPLIPKASGSTPVDRDVLLEGLRRIQGVPAVEIVADGSQTVFTVMDTTVVTLDSAMKFPETFVDPRLLSKIITACGPDAEYSYSSPDKPLVFRDGDEKIFMLMPMQRRGQ